MGVSSGDILDVHGILERVEIDNFSGLLQVCPPFLHEGKSFDTWKIIPAHISYTASRKQESIMKMWHGWDL
jgi:hypothetical protein